MPLFQGRRRFLLLLFPLLIILLVFGLIQIPRLLNAFHVTSGDAPDGDWTSSSWASANNTLLGTAANTTSKVWFTGHDGILSTIFYPSADMPNSTALEFLVGDSNHSWVDEERHDTLAQTGLYDQRSLAWATVNTAKNKSYSLKKLFYSDPTRNSVIQQVTFTALKGKLADYLLYVYYDPTLHNKGDKNSSSTQIYQDTTMLVSTSSAGDYASALAASLPYQQSMTSSGFVELNDGLTDLRGKVRCGSEHCPDFTMNYGYSSAAKGNTAQLGLLDLSQQGKVDVGSATTITFKQVLSFGQSQGGVSATAAAEKELMGTLSDGSDLLKQYVSEWQHFDGSLKTPPVIGKTTEIQQARQQQYYLSANVLKAAQDKETGAFVAGLGKPWGQWKGDDDADGYHMVWQRDQYKFASALIVAGDMADPLRAARWSFEHQQQDDGHFPQNSFVSGEPNWTGIQMDEQAYPIMLAWKLGLNDQQTYSKHIKPAADFIVQHGPITAQERWEENGGYSPASIAAEISGLLCAADIAQHNGDTASQKLYLQTADYYQSNIVNWTYTTTGPLGNGHYFERIDDDGNPNNGAFLTIGNHGGAYDEREIVDMSFLELVRQGILPPNSSYVTSSLTVVDATISQEINGQRYWFRYNHDGYGEHDDGSAYDGSGNGQLWPLLTGERGIYTVAAGGDADSYLTALMAAANSSGMIPEQVWSQKAPSGAVAGTASGSMNPLNWAMGEYVVLLVSMSEQRIADVVPLAVERYGGHGE